MSHAHFCFNLLPWLSIPCQLCWWPIHMLFIKDRGHLVQKFRVETGGRTRLIALLIPPLQPVNMTFLVVEVCCCVAATYDSLVVEACCSIAVAYDSLVVEVCCFVAVTVFVWCYDCHRADAVETRDVDVGAGHGRAVVRRRHCAWRRRLWNADQRPLTHVTHAHRRNHYSTSPFFAQWRLDFVIHHFPLSVLQCFDAVGWAAGRASGL